MLEPIEILNGSFSLICVIISTLIGLLIVSKYPKYKDRLLILVGISWIGIFSPWWPSSISFLLVLITGSGLSLPIYLALGLVPGALILLLWIYAFTDLKFVHYKRPLFIIYAIIGCFFEIYIISFIITDPSAIGELNGEIDITYKSVALYYALFIVITLLITGILFGKESLKAENPETRLKGYFLIAAFISWSIGAIMDAALPLTIINLTIARLILISSAIEFYCGFILPKFVKNLLIKQEK